MKKLICSVVLALAILNLAACSNTATFPEAQNRIGKNTLQSQSVNRNSEKYVETVESLKDTLNHLLSESLSNIYSVKPDGDTYKIKVIEDFHDTYTLYVYDSEFNQLQSISLGINNFQGIDFQDVNLDGYLDIVIKDGGTLNEPHELYIYDNSSQIFNHVIFNGFDMLSYFEVNEGYIRNWVKDSAYSVFVQELIWDGSTLNMESEEFYELKD